MQWCHDQQCYRWYALPTLCYADIDRNRALICFSRLLILTAWEPPLFILRMILLASSADFRWSREARRRYLRYFSCYRLIELAYAKRPCQGYSHFSGEWCWGLKFDIFKMITTALKAIGFHDRASSTKKCCFVRCTFSLASFSRIASHDEKCRLNTHWWDDLKIIIEYTILSEILLFRAIFIFPKRLATTTTAAKDFTSAAVAPGRRQQHYHRNLIHDSCQRVIGAVSYGLFLEQFALLAEMLGTHGTFIIRKSFEMRVTSHTWRPPATQVLATPVVQRHAG